MARKDSPGRDALLYSPSKVSWAAAEFIRKPPNWTARAFIYALSLGILVAVAYSHFSIVSITIESRGVLVTEQELFMLKAQSAFKVGRLNFRKNDLVKRGDIIVESEDQVTDSEEKTLKSQAIALNRLLAREKTGTCKDCINQLRQLSGTGFHSETKGQIKENLTAIQEGLRDLVIAKTNETNVKAVTSNSLRQITLAEEKIKEIKRQKAEKILSTQLEQLNSEIAQAKTQIADRKQQLRTAVENAASRLESKLASTLTGLESFRSQQKIIAPIDGILSTLKISGPGQVLQGGQEIAELIPLNSPLVAELSVANKDISQVRIGLMTKVKLDALPEREYGIVNGTVSVVPPNITSDQRGNSAESSYKVQVRLERQDLVKEEQSYPFKLGMTLTGLVVTKHESLLKIGIKKLFNIKDELINQ